MHRARHLLSLVLCSCGMIALAGCSVTPSTSPSKASGGTPPVHSPQFHTQVSFLLCRVCLRIVTDLLTQFSFLLNRRPALSTIKWTTGSFPAPKLHWMVLGIFMSFEIRRST